MLVPKDSITYKLPRFKNFWTHLKGTKNVIHDIKDINIFLKEDGQAKEIKEKKKSRVHQCVVEKATTIGN